MNKPTQADIEAGLTEAEKLLLAIWRERWQYDDDEPDDASMISSDTVAAIAAYLTKRGAIAPEAE